MTKIFDFKNNSLNTFRLIAALQVLWVHARTHLELSKVPIFADILDFFPGVPVFFTLSGFLIWHSIGRSNTFGEYAKKRFWRIYPELWAAVAIEIIVLLLLYKQPIDWPKLGLFAIGQATIFQFWTPDYLRGYGCGSPNGALWTIAVLIQFYFCAFFIYKWLHDKHIILWLGGALLSIVLGWLTPIIQCNLPEALGKLYGVTLIPYLWMFMVAAFAAEYREQFLSFVRKYWIVFILLLCIIRYAFNIDVPMNDYYLLFDTILLFCGLLGFSYQFPQINIKTDISYGVYIYHMTVINALMVLGFIGYSWTLWVVIVITCILAWISTETIGKISAKKKQLFSK